jgi:hypothetical protein
MPQIPSCKVMWETADGTELGFVVPVYESDNDETLIGRAWAWATAWLPAEMRPTSKSDLRVVRRKVKK